MKKNKIIALFAGVSLGLVSTAALASPSADTLLVAGYDHDQMAVLYGVSSIDQDGDEATLDCTLNGDYAYVLDSEADDDASEVAVSNLTTVDPEDGVVEFTYEDDEDQSGDKVLYADADECSLTSVKIEPNGSGEINHGKVVSTFAHLLPGGHGCLMRHIAQSDFGKGDYDELDAQSFELTLQAFETACVKNKDKKEKDDDSSSVGDDDDSSGGIGKANAPGQNKDKANKGNSGNKGKTKKSDD